MTYQNVAFPLFLENRDAMINSKEEYGSDEGNSEQEQYEENTANYDILQLDDDYYSITFCSFLNKNISSETNPDGLHTLEEAYEIFYNCLFVFALQCALILLVGTQFNELIFTTADFQTTSTRFICAILLHVQLVGEVHQTLSMLKSLSNNYEQFYDIRPAFLTVMMQLTSVTMTEVMNICLICTQNSVMDIIMNFIALGVISQIDNYYAQCFEDTKLKELLKEKGLPVIEWKTKDYSEEGQNRQRPHTARFIRFIYRIMRVIYASYYYYFMAFTVIPLTYFSEER